MNEKNYEFDLEDNNEIDLRNLLYLLLRNKSIIFITTFLGTLFGIIFTLSQKPIYIGRFQVVVDAKENVNINRNISPLKSLVDGNSDLKTEELILKSPFVLRPVYQYSISEYTLRNEPEQNWSFNKWSSTKLDISFRQGTNILNISYKDKDKNLILNTLEKIINEYQDYSKLSRNKALKKTFNFLTSQQLILEEKARNSLKEYNQFSIDNGLGDIDGFVNLGVSRSLNTNPSIVDLGVSRSLNTNPSITKLLENGTLPKLPLNSGGSSKAGQRFSKQFELLETYEAQYLDYSSVLKPSSELLSNLKIKIDNLKEALKRPNEILLKYKELSRISERDESMLIQIENDLALTKLEIAKQKDPWDMIFEPTIDDRRVSPKRTNTVFFSLLTSFILGAFLAFWREKSTGKIFELDNLKRLINCQFISYIESSTPELSKKIIFKFIETKTKENINIALRKTYFLDTFNVDNNKANIITNSLFKNEKNLIINLQNTIQIEKAEYLIIFINKNNIIKKDISLINKYISLFPSKFLGWYFLENQ